MIVESFRPGVVDRLGVGYAAVAALNPRIVYCSITGYGQTGPYRDRPGHDIDYLGLRRRPRPDRNYRRGAGAVESASG